MEKFRYRKQDQTVHDGAKMQMHHAQPYQQEDYNPLNIHTNQHHEYSHDQRQQKQQFGHDKIEQYNQQFYNDQVPHQLDHNKLQQQQQPQQYVPDHSQHRLQCQDTPAQEKAVKQHTDWNGVMKDLFGMDLPQTAESTHESTSSGVASDVTSVYLPTPTMTTFKGGDSAGSASSAKSTVSRDSGTKSASVSGSPRPDKPFQKPFPRALRTSPAATLPAVPKNAPPPLLGKNMHRLTSQYPINGHNQGSAYSAYPANVTVQKKQTRERRQRLHEPNCIQCSMTSRSYMHQRNLDTSPNLNGCQTMDPGFCCEMDQCFVEDVRDEQFVDSFGETRLIESDRPENSAPRDRLHVVSPPVCPTSPPGYCCNQPINQNNYNHHMQSDMSPQTLKSWYKQQQLQHHYQQQQQMQNRHSPADNENICPTFDVCNNHSNHHILPQPSQTRIEELRSSPNLQTFKTNNSNKTSRTPCNHQTSKPLHQSKHIVNEPPLQNIVSRSQTPRGPPVLLTHAQIHTPQPETRTRSESKIQSYLQSESHLKSFSKTAQFVKEAESSRNLLSGINNLSLFQTDNLKGKTNLVSSGGKRLTPKCMSLEFLPNDVLLKIFSNLPTDHLCKCAQVCRHWYNAVWDNPILWTSIVINNQNLDIDRALNYLTRRLSYNTPKVCMILEKININTCCRLSDGGLQTVAKRCPELRYLDMQSCHLISNVGVKEAVSRCVNLERLDVTGCPLVTCISLVDSLISQSASRHLQRIYLRYLDMTDCPNVADEDLSVITSQCTQLLFFYLRRCPLITDLGVAYIANNCCSIRELSLSDCRNVTDLGMRELSKLRENLRYLSVAKCEKVSDQGVIHIARHCSKLRYLNVRGCEAFSDTGLEFLARNCPRLRSLDIGKCDITDDGLYALSMHCPNLRKLGMKSCDAITDKGIVLIAYRCSSLQQLHVQDCCLSPDAYAMVRKYCKKAIIEHTNPAIL